MTTKRFPKDEYGWKTGPVFNTRVHKFRNEYIVNIAHKDTPVTRRKYKTLREANAFALTYLKIKRSRYYE